MEKNWEKRSIPVSIILSIVTCGLYGLYWYYKLTNDTHQAVGRKTTASGGRAILFAIITCGIYSIYWAYKMGDAVVEAKEARGMRSDRNLPIIYLVLTFFGLGIITWALMQSSLNDMIDQAEPVQDDVTAPEAVVRELPAVTSEQESEKTEPKD